MISFLIFLNLGDYKIQDPLGPLGEPRVLKMTKVLCAALDDSGSIVVFLLESYGGFNVVSVYIFQADQRFVWNGNLLRELASQPEVSHLTCGPEALLFIVNICAWSDTQLRLLLHSFTSLHYPSFMDVSFFRSHKIDTSW